MKIQPVRGTHDIFGKELISYQFIIKNISKLAEIYDYKEIIKCLNLENLEFNKKKIFTFKIGENGKKLSEGQKQRLAIARSVYRNSKILFLDEITSALDEKNEINIIKLLKKLNKEKTIIFVSHKKSSLKYCNKIFEFKKNKLFKVQKI